MDANKLIWPFNQILPLVYNDALTFDENVKCLMDKCNEIIDNAESVPDFVYQLLQSYTTDLVISATYDEDKRCIVVDQILSILTQPTSVVVHEESKIVTLTAYVAGATNYRWQYSNDNGATWFDCTEQGADTYEMKVVAITSKNNWLYRLRVNNRMRVDYTNRVSVKVG